MARQQSTSAIDPHLEVLQQEWAHAAPVLSCCISKARGLCVCLVHCCKLHTTSSSQAGVKQPANNRRQQQQQQDQRTVSQSAHFIEQCS
jgi:hypothetical protein